MLIKKHKIFTYNNYPDKEVDIIVKLIINIEGVIQNGFVYEMS